MDHSHYSFPKIHITADGSSSLIHAQLGELYHSRHGAWTESNHIFIQNGLLPFIDQGKKELRVFEMGFGSGLNAALSREAALEKGISIEYTSIELFPVDRKIIRQMDFPFPDTESKDRFLEIHDTEWNRSVRLDPHFTLHKIQGQFPEDVSDDPGAYDILYYDAFAPGAQPELWEVEAMERCYAFLNPGGVWISFSSKGSVQRNLKVAGFEVEKLPGPPGKREITRAVKR